MTDSYARVEFRGVVVNVRTRWMLLIAERRARAAGLGTYLRLTQGSYTTANPASADTHAGGGAVDVAAAELSTEQRLTVVTELRRIGFAAWLRTPAQADPPWPYHVHAIAVGDVEMSSAAAWQVGEYRAGRNGLKGRGDDDGPAVEWSEFLQEGNMARTITDEDVEAIGRWLLDEAKIPKLSTPEPGDTISLRSLLAYRLDRGTVNALDQLGQIREVLAAGGSLDTAAIVAQINELPAEIRAELAGALATPAP